MYSHTSSFLVILRQGIITKTESEEYVGKHISGKSDMENSIEIGISYLDKEEVYSECW